MIYLLNFYCFECFIMSGITVMDISLGGFVILMLYVGAVCRCIFLCYLSRCTGRLVIWELVLFTCCLKHWIYQLTVDSVVMNMHRNHSGRNTHTSNECKVYDCTVWLISPKVYPLRIGLDYFQSLPQSKRYTSSCEGHTTGHFCRCKKSNYIRVSCTGSGMLQSWSI